MVVKNSEKPNRWSLHLNQGNSASDFVFGCLIYEGIRICCWTYPSWGGNNNGNGEQNIMCIYKTSCDSSISSKSSMYCIVCQNLQISTYITLSKFCGLHLDWILISFLEESDEFSNDKKLSDEVSSVFIARHIDTFQWQQWLKFHDNQSLNIQCGTENLKILYTGRNWIVQFSSYRTLLCFHIAKVWNDSNHPFAKLNEGIQWSVIDKSKPFY